MGCFSYICPKCGKGIKSGSFVGTGEQCHLFYMEKGNIIEAMSGEYDSYGRIFGPTGESVEWKSRPWIKLVDVHFNDDQTSGFLAFHKECVPQIFGYISEDDPNQGWGETEEEQERYF